MAQVSMPQIDALRETFGEPAKDMKLNLGAIASSDYLDDEQLWGVALASASIVMPPLGRFSVVTGETGSRSALA